MAVIRAGWIVIEQAAGDRPEGIAPSTSPYICKIIQCRRESVKLGADCDRAFMG
jgi:hypothetical protein